MNSDVKKELYMCSVFELKTLETHFTRMAAKGWLVTKMKLFSYEYKKIEPCELQFFIDILPQITAFDYPENDSTLEYRRICEESGWTFAAASKQIQVFYTEKKNDMPVPIHTDSKIEAKIVLKTSLKYELPSFLIGIYYLLFSYIRAFNMGYDIFLLNMSIAQITSTIVYTLPFLWYISSLVIWLFKTIRRTKKELPPIKISYKISRIRALLFSISTIFILVAMLVGVLLDIQSGLPPIFFIAFLLPFSGVATGLLIRKRIDSKKRSSADNKWIFAISIVILIVFNVAVMSFIISTMGSSLSNVDGLPENRVALRLIDFGVKATPKHYNYYGRSSIVVPLNYTYYEIVDEGSVHTEVKKAINGFLANKLFNNQFEELSKKDWMVITEMTMQELELWNATEGYYLNADKSNLLLLYGKLILQIEYRGEGIKEDSVRERVKAISLQINSDL